MADFLRNTCGTVIEFRGAQMVERVRQWVRGLLGSQSLMYVAASELMNILFAFVREGFVGLRVLGMRKDEESVASFKFRNLAYPISLRGGTDDIPSVINNIFRQEYGGLPRRFYPEFVVDAGAYIGDTAAYFLSRYPGARLLALEPNPESYAIARKNLLPYGDRAQLIQEGLWSSVGHLIISGSQTGAGLSPSDTAAEGVRVSTTTVSDLMRRFDMPQIHLFKLDIEGAEVEVLRDGVESGWLAKVGVLLLETHGKDIEDVVLPLLERSGFKVERHRNVWYCTNSALVD